MSEPISPNDIPGLKKNSIPAVVIDTINSLVTRNFSGSSARVTQPEIVEALEEAGIKRHEIFDNNWLDIESMYEERGWKKVTYEKRMAYAGETGPDYFIFEAP